jgi:endonuclease/exonuclease/phosphatase family metal-dependent hydrolase
MLLVVVPAWAQWDPANGQWGKDDAHDLRVMTYNILDNIRTEEPKTEELNAWHALTRIVAAMRPDVLILQEAGDNNCYQCVDSVAELTTVLELFMHGGTDPFLGGAVGAYVQKYAPDYDLPYIFVSTRNDGYNRNAILSRYPFADLNGDTRSQLSDIGMVLPDAYAPGGTGGIRGFMFTEIDLPDADYAGDLVFGGAHLKAGYDGHSDRVAAARNVAYYIDYMFNGAGTGLPDPNNKIVDNPAAQTILDDDTPVIIAGDWNEDEQYSMSQYGEKGPAAWLTQAAVLGGTDGTDRDRTDMTYDDARNPKNNDRATHSSSKLDYVAWQDSIATLRRAFIFYSSTLSSTPSWFPPEFTGFPVPALASGLASDHRPVIADFILPEPSLLPGDVNGDGEVNNFDIGPFVFALTHTPAEFEATYPGGCYDCADVNDDGEVDNFDISAFVALIVG